MAVRVGFRCEVISCELVRRGVRRGAAEASGSGGVQRVWEWQPVGLTSILDQRQFI